MSVQTIAATDRAIQNVAYEQKRDRILALWNTGDHTMAEIGVVFGMQAVSVGSVLRRARLAGLEVLTITPSVKGRRAALSRRLWRADQPGMRAITPDGSLQLRDAWLSGTSAARIAVILDTQERLVRLEARRLGLPHRKHARARVAA